MTTFLNLVQGSLEWHEFRRTKIGASDAAAIMGVSPWLTPYKLWRLKMGLDKGYVSKAMGDGSRREGPIRDAYNLQHGTNFRAEVVVHNEYPWALASLDGAVRERIQHDGIIEIKTTKVLEDMLEGNKLCDHYYSQVQHQMALTDLNEVTVVISVSEGGELIEHVVERDYAYIDELMEKEKEFFQYMLDFTPPPLTDRDYVKRLDPEWESYATLARDAQMQLSKWEKILEEIKSSLVKLSKNEPSDGFGVRITLCSRSGMVDYKAIPELKGVDLTPYRKPALEYWKLSIK